MIDKILITIILIYTFLMLMVINWGIPNKNHPFTYQMDEWHQLQSVKSVFKYGTPNVAGAAHGPMFQYLLSGIFLIPFIILGIVNPFIIKSSLDSLAMQERLFEILRLNTLIFGILSLIVAAKIAKDYFKINSVITLLFFVITPIWLSLSNYFKYDIALVFWILLTIFFLLKYEKNQSLRNLIFSGISCSLAIATKISALPLLLIYFFAFFYFTPKTKRKYKNLLIAALIIFSIFVLVGVPDLLFRWRDYYEFLYSNIISVPNETVNFNLSIPYWLFLILEQMPTVFGRVFFVIFIISFVYWVLIFIKEFKKKNLHSFRKEIFIFVSLMLFTASLIPLKLYASGNRALVLLPFLTLLSSLALTKFFKVLSQNFRKVLIIFLAIGFVIQAIESFSWVLIKVSPDPRESSSVWILKNVPKTTIIGVENIPIYQMLPDIVVKEYYFYQYKVNEKYNFKYEVINADVKKLPSLIIISNPDFENRYVKDSDKKRLIARLNKEGYQKRAQFEPNWGLYKFFGSELNFSMANIVPMPTLAIFMR